MRESIPRGISWWTDEIEDWRPEEEAHDVEEGISEEADGKRVTKKEV